ncbi:ribbon-helix-helix protein, CopG family [Nostoc sp.]|uniref:ribbon-helix-helix protein, CopG family n=1 Tax=Nostoc sp. TaxID=1180 RepID=UPI002FF49268
MNKKTLITLNLSDSELYLLNELSEKKEMNKSAVLRQALRMLGMIEKRIEQGEKIYFESLDKEKSEVIML